MNLLPQIVQDLSRFTAQTVVSGLWQGAVLTAFVAAALHFIPNLTAKVRFLLWIATFAVATIVPFLHLSAHTVVESQPPAVIHLEAAWAVAIAILWLALSTIRTIQLARQALRLRRVWTEATPTPPGSSIATLLSASPRRPQLCTSPHVDTPSVLGFSSPRLLIPDWLYPTLTEPELRHIVLHECEHLRRYDDWLNLAQKIALAVFPLNPALLFADRRLSLERELACDAGVVAATAAPLAYASSLTRLAERRILRRSRLTLALSAWSRQSELVRRVQCLLRPARSMTSLQIKSAASLLSLGLAAATLELAHAPRILSFAQQIPTSLATSLPEVVSASTGVQAVPVVFRQSTPLVTTQTCTLHVHPARVVETALRKRPRSHGSIRLCRSTPLSPDSCSPPPKLPGAIRASVTQASPASVPSTPHGQISRLPTPPFHLQTAGSSSKL